MSIILYLLMDARMLVFTEHVDAENAEITRRCEQSIADFSAFNAHLRQSNPDMRGGKHESCERLQGLSIHTHARNKILDTQRNA